MVAATISNLLSLLQILGKGLSKGDAIETYRRLVTEDRAQFVGQQNTRVKVRRSGSFPGTEDVL